MAASAVSSAAALIVLDNLRGFGEVKEKVGDCFHGTEARSLGLRPEKGGVKREAWVAMAMGKNSRRFEKCLVVVL